MPENYDMLIFVCTRGGWGSQMGPLGKVSGLPLEENTPKKLSNPLHLGIIIGQPILGMRK